MFYFSIYYIYSETSDRSDLDLWNMVRVINILIMVRLLRIIWHIKVGYIALTVNPLHKNQRIVYFFIDSPMLLFRKTYVLDICKNRLTDPY